MSYWLTNAPYQNFHSTPELPRYSEAVVIGGGITGLSTAYWLRKYGIEVALLEARGLAGGATGRNGGQIVSGPAVNFAESLRRYGPENSKAIYQFTLDTITALEKFIQDNRLACDLSLQGTVTLALTEEEEHLLEESARLLAEYNLPQAWWSATECQTRTGSTSFKAGLFNPRGGQLWPARLVFGLAEQAQKQWARIYTQTQVQSVRREADRLFVECAEGTIETKHVVYATNAWTRKLIPELNRTITPVRGQVIITAPAPRLWPFGMVADYGYEYWIQRPDGRIVLGGMRTRSDSLEIDVEDDSTVHPAVSQGLREFLPKHFPTLQKIPVEQEWTGIMGWSPDLNPLVGPVPRRPGEYIAAGYSGHGMPIAFGAGQQIAGLIAGQPVKLVEAFAPDRYLK